MFFSLLLALAAASASALPTYDIHWPAFTHFMATHQKTYASVQVTTERFAIFKRNLALIEQRNANGGATHGVNQFSDLSPEEFKQTYLVPKSVMVQQCPPHQSAANSTRLASKLLKATASVDWRDHNVVSAVKNQGQCGSCWAFSATEQIESCNALSTGKNVETLAPQQIVSCDTGDGGCNGGFPSGGYEYVMQAGGLELEKDYPYTSGSYGDSGSCTFDKSKIAVKAPASWKYISQTPATEKDMLAQVGASPMSIAVAADIWQSYQSGIITANAGCGTDMDHAVQVVGYNGKGKTPYWIVRNSWGAAWGQSGYIYVEAGSNVCGIAQCTTIVEPCSGGPTPPPTHHSGPTPQPTTAAPTPTPKNYLYASLDGTDPSAADDHGCEGGCLNVPDGWEVAPNSTDVIDVISTHPWGTDCMITSEGGSWGTSGCTADNECRASPGGDCWFYKGSPLVDHSNGCWEVLSCNRRVLIRKEVKDEFPATLIYVPGGGGAGAATQAAKKKIVNKSKINSSFKDANRT